VPKTERGGKASLLVEEANKGGKTRSEESPKALNGGGSKTFTLTIRPTQEASDAQETGRTGRGRGRGAVQMRGGKNQGLSKKFPGN